MKKRCPWHQALEKAEPPGTLTLLAMGTSAGAWEGLSCQAIADILKTRNDYLGEGDKKEKNGGGIFKAEAMQRCEGERDCDISLQTVHKATEGKARREMGSHPK